MFFDYRQNNSGGSFVVDEERGISVNVIIEADNAQDAEEWEASRLDNTGPVVYNRSNN